MNGVSNYRKTDKVVKIETQLVNSYVTYSINSPTEQIICERQRYAMSMNYDANKPVFSAIVFSPHEAKMKHMCRARISKLFALILT